MNFRLDHIEVAKINKWTIEHKCNISSSSGEKYGAIGDRMTYCFTPTSLGIIKVVKCACGESLNLTEYETW